MTEIEKNQNPHQRTIADGQAERRADDVTDDAWNEFAGHQPRTEVDPRHIKEINDIGKTVLEQELGRPPEDDQPPSHQ